MGYLLFPLAFGIGGAVEGFRADASAMQNARSVASAMGAAILGFMVYFLLAFIETLLST